MNHDTQPVDQSLSAIAVQWMKTRTKGKGATWEKLRTVTSNREPSNGQKEDI